MRVLFLLIIFSFTAARAWECRDVEFQQVITRVREHLNSSQPQVMNYRKSIPSHVYTTLDVLSIANMGKVVSDLRWDAAMLGPSTGDNYINFNPEILEHYRKLTRNPQKNLEFILAHELAHQVQRYDFRLSQPHAQVERGEGEEAEIAAHGVTDCVALSLMKNAKMTFDLEQAAEAQNMIRLECYQYRTRAYCDRAYEVRFRHMKSWIETTEYDFLVPL